MKKLYILLRGMFFLWGWLLMEGSAFSQVQTPRLIATGPNSNAFYEYLPSGYSTDTTVKHPLLVFIHGAGELGNGRSELGWVLRHGPPYLIAFKEWPDSFTVNGKSYSFIVISPQFVNWPNVNDVNDVIQYALAHYRVDTGRVYLTGLSMGGSATWSYASVTPQFAYTVAAIVPIAGGGLWGMYPATILANANVAVYGVSNLNDPAVPDSNTVDAVKMINSVVPAIQPAAIDTIYNASGHDSWTVTYNPSTLLYKGMNIYQWMLLYSRDKTAPIPPAPPPPVVKLPDSVALSSFTAEVLAGQSEVGLNWTTSFEQNDSYFVVQRSSDGQLFNNIDTVSAVANADKGYSYSAVDSQPLADSDFYRLQIVFLDSTTSYSVIREVVFSPNPNSFVISPNPASGTLKLMLRNNGSGTLDVRLLDIQGRTLRTWVFLKQDELWTQSIDVGYLPTGSYVIQVIGSSMRVTRSFIKK